jgi:hypothetical protein
LRSVWASCSNFRKATSSSALVVSRFFREIDTTFSGQLDRSVFLLSRLDEMREISLGHTLFLRPRPVRSIPRRIDPNLLPDHSGLLPMDSGLNLVHCCHDE